MDSANAEISHRFPQLLPDEKSILFTIKQSNIATFDDALIAIQDLSTGRRKVLVHGGAYARYVPTGHLAYVRGKSILLVPFDLDRWEVTGSSSEVLEGGWMNQGSGDAKYSFTAGGLLAFIPLGNVALNINTVNWLDRTGGVRPVLQEPKAYYTAGLSPDGQKLCLNINAANDDIWVYHLTRQTLSRVTFGGGNHASPVWSPDGKYIYYSAESGQTGSICRKPWDGSGVGETLASINGAFLTDVSRDGKSLIFARNGDIWVLPLEKHEGVWNFTNSSPSEYGRLSPDGAYMAYESNESGTFEIYVTPFPGKQGKWQISGGGGRRPIWSHTGTRLFYQRGSSMMAVDVSGGSSFDFSTPAVFSDLPSSTIPCDVSMDDRQFLVITSQTEGISTRRIDVITDWFQEIRERYTK